MKELHNLGSYILNLDEISQLNFFYSEYEDKVNKKILLASINFILSIIQFAGQLM